MFEQGRIVLDEILLPASFERYEMQKDETQGLGLDAKNVQRYGQPCQLIFSSICRKVVLLSQPRSRWAASPIGTYMLRQSRRLRR